ncbi:MAG: RNA 2',3'-cyclic phosphodiesterase [Nannocystaceae bacterium]|nr:RNA 2',3'-cyclic phosphodiesterase [bacterium]
MASKSKKSSRLFVGIAMPPLLAQQLVLLGGGIEGARWEPAEKLHLTLRFVGDVDGGMRAALDTALRSVRGERFSLTLRGCGHFPPRGEPRALWVGLEDSPPLRALQQSIEAALREAGFEPDTRNFAPHVTLARLRRANAKKLAGWLSSHALWDAPPFSVEAFTLFSSILGPGGSKYTPEATYPLDGPATP